MRRLRQELSAAKAELREAQETSASVYTQLEEEELHNGTLRRMLDDAYRRLREAGLLDELDFPVSRGARRLHTTLQLPASYDDVLAAGEALGCEEAETNTYLEELVEEGVVRRVATPGPGDGHQFHDTGYRPFF